VEVAAPGEADDVGVADAGGTDDVVAADGLDEADDDRSPPPSAYRIVVRSPGTTAAGELGPSCRGIDHARVPELSEMADTSSRSTTTTSSPTITGAGMPAKCVWSPIPVERLHASRKGGAGASGATPVCCASRWYCDQAVSATIVAADAAPAATEPIPAAATTAVAMARAEGRGRKARHPIGGEAGACR
jgi:hypothetical protein